MNPMMQIELTIIICFAVCATAANSFLHGPKSIWNSRQRQFSSIFFSTPNHQALGYTLKERNPYDVHVYYSTEEEKEQAFKLRGKMQSKFSSWMRFYEPKNRPIGPHPVPMWEVDFSAYENRHRLQEVCDFLEKERGDLSILIHPHSTDTDYADHTKHAIWFGEPLELRFRGWAR